MYLQYLMTKIRHVRFAVEKLKSWWCHLDIIVLISICRSISLQTAERVFPRKELKCITCNIYNIIFYNRFFLPVQNDSASVKASATSWLILLLISIPVGCTSLAPYLIKLNQIKCLEKKIWMINFYAHRRQTVIYFPVYHT